MEQKLAKDADWTIRAVEIPKRRRVTREMVRELERDEKLHAVAKIAAKYAK